MAEREQEIKPMPKRVKIALAGMGAGVIIGVGGAIFGGCEAARVPDQVDLLPNHKTLIAQSADLNKLLTDAQSKINSYQVREAMKIFDSQQFKDDLAAKQTLGDTLSQPNPNQAKEDGYFFGGLVGGMGLMILSIAGPTLGYSAVVRGKEKIKSIGKKK